MEFYFNHNRIQKEIGQSVSINIMPDACREFVKLVAVLDKKGDKLLLIEDWAAQMYESGLDYRLYFSFFQYLSRTGYIEKTSVIDRLTSRNIIPDVENENVRLILSYCLRDEQDKFVSLTDDEAASFDVYSIISPKEWKVRNLIGKEKIEEYHIYNPMPDTIQELFEKVERDYSGIIFTSKAFETAQKRENAYKQFGFEKLLFIFYGINEMLLPFYRQELHGLSEKQIFGRFAEQYKVEVSPDSEKTMKMYGYERKVIIDNEIYTMCNHIKIPVQATRIYFKYIDGKIYVGHCGEHLRTANDR